MSKPNTSRHARAMPVETIITRFKSAQQKRQLREMDRSMTKVTELLKSPVKPRMKKKEPHRKEQRLSTIIPIREGEEGKRSKKNKNRCEKEVEEELCPMKLKRHVVLNKVKLKPKHDLKIIACTNKRKRSVPQKGFSQQSPPNLDQPSDSRDTSPGAKRTRPQDLSMDEMIQLIEDSGSLNDEDLLEILTCPSPVWWEDPPDGYIEDALFTRPRSAAEMYPSVRSQLQGDLQERQRSSTPNILSRKERFHRSVKDKRDHDPVVTKNEEKERKSSNQNNNDNIDLDIKLTKRDEKFIKKRSKLESVLGNLKNKTSKETIKTAIDLKSKVTKAQLDDSISDNLSNKVSVIKNLCSKEVEVEKELESGVVVNQTEDKAQVAIDKEKASVPMATDPESTDDEHLTDISFQDDAYLNDLENMDIPIEGTVDLTPKEEKIEEKSETLVAVPEVKKKADFFRDPDKRYRRIDSMSSCMNKCNAINFKASPIDPTYSDKESSIIEDYFEMKLFEEEDTVLNKKENEYSKCGFKSVPTIKCKNVCKEKEKKSSVIKFKNSDNTCINVFKIESVVPDNLPPLKNSGSRKNSVGCMPEILPPLRRNPGVIHLNSESPKSCRSTSSFSSNSSGLQDNMDSISDTNICFLNDDDEDEKKTDEIQSSVIKSNNEIKNIGLLIRKPSNEILKKCNGESLPTNLQFTEDEVLYRNFTQIDDVISNDCNELEVQSLTITKVNDNSCCIVEKKSKPVMKKDGIKCKKGKYRKTDLLAESNKCTQTEYSRLIHNEIGKIENDNSECITVYKIVSDDSGNDEPKIDYINSPNKINDIKDTTDETIDKNGSIRDKMVFYFKKCKNLCWKHKTHDNIEEKKDVIEKDNLINETNITDIRQDDKDKKVIDNVKQDNKIIADNVKTSKINTGSVEIKETEGSEVNHNNNLTDKERKFITVANTKPMRYCMKCSSIFDTEQCNYCYRKNSIDNKQQTTDYFRTMQQIFVCDICRYKALSKDSLERHIMSRCCDSKHR